MESLFAARDRLAQEGEILDGKTLISAHGHRRWRAERVEAGALRMGYAPSDTVYSLWPLGGDTFGFGGVKRIVRSEHELVTNGWRVVV
jgi:hypothetical protein